MPAMGHNAAVKSPPFTVSITISSDVPANASEYAHTLPILYRDARSDLHKTSENLEAFFQEEFDVRRLNKVSRYHPTFRLFMVFCGLDQSRSGKSGYRAVMTSLTSRADYLADAILAIGGGERFITLSRTGGKCLPLVTWRFKSIEPYDGE